MLHRAGSVNITGVSVTVRRTGQDSEGDAGVSGSVSTGGAVVHRAGGDNPSVRSLPGGVTVQYRPISPASRRALAQVGAAVESSPAPAPPPRATGPIPGLAHPEPGAPAQPAGEAPAFTVDRRTLYALADDLGRLAGRLRNVSEALYDAALGAPDPSAPSAPSAPSMADASEPSGQAPFHFAPGMVPGLPYAPPAAVEPPATPPPAGEPPPPSGEPK